MQAEKLKKIKFKHHSNLGSKVLAVLAGRSGCGKTYLLFKILTTPNFLDFNNLIIFTKTAHQPIYQCLLHGFNNGLSKTAIASIFKIYEESEDEEDVEELCTEAAKNKSLLTDVKVTVVLTDDSSSINDPSKLDKRKKNVIIFDDCVNDGNQTVQNNYFISGRHSNCSVFYLAQNLYSLNTTIRRNTNIFILFELDGRSFQEVLKLFPLDIKAKFRQEAEQTWNKEYGYITYNLDLPKTKRIIINLLD